MTKTSLLLLLSYLVITSAFSQNEKHLLIKGKVRSETEQLMYVTLGIVNENIGTISGQTGYFELKIPNRLINKKLTVSHVGYETGHFRLDSLTQLDAVDISLRESAVELEDVVITADGLKPITKTYGIVRKYDSFAWIQDGDAGSEIVTLIQPKEEIFLEYVAVNVYNMDKQEFTLLLNLYSRDEDTGLPSGQLLKKQMIINSNKKKGWLEVNLKEQQLLLAEPFFVGFQWTNMDDPVPMVGVKPGKSDESLLRTQAFGEWQQQYIWNIKAVGFEYK